MSSPYEKPCFSSQKILHFSQVVPTPNYFGDSLSAYGGLFLVLFKKTLKQQLGATNAFLRKYETKAEDNYPANPH
jgi:hypothetical protein